MNKQEEFVNGLYEYIQDKFESRFIGYAIGDMGLIEGRLDRRKIYVQCRGWHVIFGIDFSMNDKLIYEIANIVREYIGDNEIRSQCITISRENELEEVEFHLVNSLNKENGYQYVK